jgi:auxin-responsive protein IAA
MAAAAMSYAHADVENLKATELRLGLPGAEESDKMPTPPSTPRAGNKRALAGDLREEEPKTAPPAAKAQVVGWPPVRSYRKSCFQQQSTKSKVSASAPEKKQEEVAVAAVVAPPAAAGSAGSLYVKVSMDGAPYLRKIDLKMYKGYRELREALEAMFLGFSGDASSVNPSDFAVTYEDKDGDLMLVGDVPFEMFMSTCKRMRIMKGSEARGLGSSKE